jgi:hypothetical protein
MMLRLKGNNPRPQGRCDAAGSGFWVDSFIDPIDLGAPVEVTRSRAAELRLRGNLHIHRQAEERRH